MKKRKIEMGHENAGSQKEPSVATAIALAKIDEQGRRFDACQRLRDEIKGPSLTEREKTIVELAVQRAQEEMYDKLLRSGVI